MKRKYILAFAALTLGGGLHAQDIYKIETLGGTDLNGTARYVGMGGAMSALGADLSVIGTNPGAIGLYRSSDVSMTGSVGIQPNGFSMENVNKARPSFDQLGFVYACPINGKHLKFVNFAFNYHKRRNFKQTIGLNGIGLDGGLSQSMEILDMAYDGSGNPLDLRPGSNDREGTMPVALAAFDSWYIAPLDASGKLIADDGQRASSLARSYGNAYNYHRVQWGGVQQYDFNVSFNHDDQIYWGMTLGVYNVNMHSRLAYDEQLIDDPNSLAPNYGDLLMDYTERITGNGVDFKLGAVIRPIETSPFRLGFSISTPIYYDLTQDNYVGFESPYPDYRHAQTGPDGTQQVADRTYADIATGDFDYRIWTPWRFNLSAATTVGNYLALGAEYEAAVYTSSQVRYPDGGDYYYSGSTKDRYLIDEVKDHMRTEHTLRLGLEARLSGSFYGRLGYNLVSSPFKKSAYLNLFTASPSYYYRGNTDYVNLKSTQRVTAGLGFRRHQFYADIAYQYQVQQGEVYAFHVPESKDMTNALQGQKVDLNRHQLMLTVGYKF